MNDGDGIIYMEFQVFRVRISVFLWTESVSCWKIEMLFCVLNLGKENNFWSCRDFGSLSPLEPGLSPAGRMCHVVGRLICLRVFVPGDSRVWRQGCSYHSNRVSAFSPGVGSVTTHRWTSFSVLHSFWNCDNRNTCFCPSEHQQHFPKRHLLDDTPAIPLTTHFQVYQTAVP